jgi:hypothetical protein
MTQATECERLEGAVVSADGSSVFYTAGAELFRLTVSDCTHESVAQFDGAIKPLTGLSVGGASTVYVNVQCEGPRRELRKIDPNSGRSETIFGNSDGMGHIIVS